MGTSCGGGEALFCLLHINKNMFVNKSAIKLDDKNCHKPQIKHKKENQQVQGWHGISISAEKAEENTRCPMHLKTSEL